MARLLLDEGREVVALVDGDAGGKTLGRAITKLNASLRLQPDAKPVTLVALDEGKSIEDILPSRENYFRSVLAAAEELVAGGFRERSDIAPNEQAMLQALMADLAGRTLGKHVEIVTEKWFKCGEPISKLSIARHYGTWLQSASPRELGVTSAPQEILAIVKALRLGSKTIRAELFGVS